MENKTANCLVEACRRDMWPDVPTMVDYWGPHIGNDENEGLILGVYQGLCMMGVTAEDFHRSFMQNSLDGLIHSRYKARSSGYYRDFVKNNIVIGRTCTLEPPKW
jgi:hypothetical protein